MRANIKLIVDMMCENEISQKQLAEACGVQTATINRILIGKSNPNIGTIGKIANCFNCKPSELIEV